MPAITTPPVTFSPYTALYSSLVPDTAITTSVSTRNGRTGVVLDFKDASGNGAGLYARDFACAISFPVGSNTALYGYQPNFIPLPESTYNRVTDWFDAGTPGNKLVQGILVTADSFGAAKTFFLQDSDTMQLHGMFESPAIFANQTTRAFSCQPFQAHMVRIVASDSVAWRLFKYELAFNPYPEAAAYWATELTSLGGTGWNHLGGVANIEYAASAQVTLSFVVDTGSGSYAPPSIILPATTGQTKVKVEAGPNKWKLLGIVATSGAPFNLFEEGCNFAVMSWGNDSAYRTVRPFGGATKASAEV